MISLVTRINTKDTHVFDVEPAARVLICYEVIVCRTSWLMGSEQPLPGHCHTKLNQEQEWHQNANIHTLVGTNGAADSDSERVRILGPEAIHYEVSPRESGMKVGMLFLFSWQLYVAVADDIDDQ
jgi:hypothetical protein